MSHFQWLSDWVNQNEFIQGLPLWLRAIPLLMLLGVFVFISIKDRIEKNKRIKKNKDRTYFDIIVCLIDKIFNRDN
jgi:hypothetical protein